MTDEDFDFDSLLGTVPDAEITETEEIPKPAPKKTVNITDAQKEARRLNAIKASGIAAQKKKERKEAKLAAEAKLKPKQSKPIDIPKKEVSDDEDEELVINEPEETYIKEEKPIKKTAYELQLEKQMEELREHTNQIEAKMKKEKKPAVNVNINHLAPPVIQNGGQAEAARKKLLFNF